MHTTFTFNPITRKINAVFTSDGKTYYADEVDLAYDAIDTLCDRIEPEFGRVVSGQVMLFLRQLYCKIVKYVLNNTPNTVSPNIWDHDCNQIASLVGLTI